MLRMLIKTLQNRRIRQTNPFSRLRSPQSGQARSASSGQALVVLLLILVVTMTVGLSVVSRTLTNVKEASTTERSTRAFNAAEAGVEVGLRNDLAALLPSGGPTATTLPAVNVGNANSTVTISRAGGNSDAYEPVKAINKDDVIQLTLEGATANGVYIYWAKKNTDEDRACDLGTPTNGSAALEITMVSWDGSSATYPITRYSYNPAGCNIATNGFTNSNADPDANGYRSKQQIPLPIPVANARIMRLRPIYNKASIKVVPYTIAAGEGNGIIPVQSYKVRSEGIAGDTKRVVEVERSIGGLPHLFDYVLFNGSATCPLQKGTTCP